MPITLHNVILYRIHCIGKPSFKKVFKIKLSCLHCCIVSGRYHEHTLGKNQLKYYQAVMVTFWRKILPPISAWYTLSAETPS